MRLTDTEARNLAEQAYEQIAPGCMFSTLPTTLQDLLVEIVDTAIELEGIDGGYCAECDEHVTEKELHCEACWLKKHAETCQTCNGEIPMADQRCWACVENAVRMELAVNEIDSKTIDAVIKELRP